MSVMTEPKNSRPGSRHKDKHTVRFPGTLYGLMALLARQTRRDIKEEFIIACEERLKAEGLWPEGCPSTEELEQYLKPPEKPKGKSP